MQVPRSISRPDTFCDGSLAFPILETWVRLAISLASGTARRYLSQGFGYPFGHYGCLKKYLKVIWMSWKNWLQHPILSQLPQGLLVQASFLEVGATNSSATTIWKIVDIWLFLEKAKSTHNYNCQKYTQLCTIVGESRYSSSTEHKWPRDEARVRRAGIRSRVMWLGVLVNEVRIYSVGYITGKTKTLTPYNQCPYVGSSN